jgi:transcriptional antiterminator RfaH
MSFWAVVMTHARGEDRAIMHAERWGFVTYAPREKIIRRRKGGRKVTDSHWLFPRYLFVRIEDQWQNLWHTIGISGVLMSGDMPAALPEGWVEGLKARERNGLVVLTKSRFKEGQRVQVTAGLFSGQRGLYQGMTTRQREIVLLDTLGRVELAPGLLR